MQQCMKACRFPLFSFLLKTETGPQCINDYDMRGYSLWDSDACSSPKIPPQQNMMYDLKSIPIHPSRKSE